jgi:hypothetical protein
MHKIIDYLIEEWSYEIAGKFTEITELRLQTLTIEPFIGIISPVNNIVRSIVLTKQNKLYYEIRGGG